MAEGFIARALGPGPGAQAADEDDVDPSAWASLPAEAADGAPAANDDGAGKPVVPEQLKLDLQRVAGPPADAAQMSEGRLSEASAQVLREAPEQAQVETSAEALTSSGPITTLPPGPLLSGRSEAADETRPSPEEKASARGEKPASGDPKPIAVPRSQDSPSPRERAERDLLEGGVESGAQDFYEPDL